MCEDIKRDWLFADCFFFQESTEPLNIDDATYHPIFDTQALIMDACEHNDVVWIQASRGSAKSYTVARWIVSYCLRHRNQKVVITAPSFRQSKGVFDYCIQILKNNMGVDSHVYKLEQECDLNNDVKRGHEVIAVLSTGSTIEALPMGEGETIRGKRATVVVCDEFYLYKKEMYVSHVMPFLNVQMGENAPKLIHMTTSYYCETFAYGELLKIAKFVKAGVPGYAIVDITIDDLLHSTALTGRDDPNPDRHFPVGEKIVLHQLETQYDPVTKRLTEDALMTFYNVWIKSSAGFYKADVIHELQQPHIPVLPKRPEGCDYPFVLGVDPAAQGKDKTAMAVMGLPGEDVRHLHAVYQWERLKPEEIAGYIHQMVDRYGMEWILIDKSGPLGAIVAERCSAQFQIINGIPEERQPILPHDHPDAWKARAKIILTKPSDDMIGAGVFHEVYNKTVTGEIDLKNAMHLVMRSVMENGKFLAPGTIDRKAYYDPDAVSSTRGDIIDNIREALAQFPRIDRKKDSEGNLMVDGRGNWTFTRPPKDDGAYAIVYANFCANIVYRKAVFKKSDAVTVMWHDEAPQEEVLIHPHQVFTPRLF